MTTEKIEPGDIIKGKAKGYADVEWLVKEVKDGHVRFDWLKGEYVGKSGGIDDGIGLHQCLLIRKGKPKAEPDLGWVAFVRRR